MGKGRYQKTKTENPVRKKRKWYIIPLVLLLLIGILAGAGMWYVSSLTGLVQRAEMEHRDPAPEDVQELLGGEYVPDSEFDVPEQDGAERKDMGKIINILLIGQDQRKGGWGKNSDTMILCTVNKETKVLTLTSFLRDAFTYFPPYKECKGGRNRINAAYAYGYSMWGDLGAMTYLDLTIQRNFGVEVDHNIEVNFESFVQVIDLIGDIEVELDANEAAYMTTSCTNEGIPRQFSAGKTMMNGEETLIYARMRHSSAGDSDFKRTARQRNVVTRIFEKCKDMSWKELDALMRAVLPNVLTDMTDEDIMNYAMDLLPLLPKLTVETVQCPAAGTLSGRLYDIYGDGGQHSVQFFDEKANTEMMRAICEEEP